MRSETGLKQICLHPIKIKDKETMAASMNEVLDLPDYFGGNLDALADVLSEISRETVFEVEISDIDLFSKEEYAIKVLKVISRACEENPHLHLYLTDRG